MFRGHTQKIQNILNAPLPKWLPYLLGSGIGAALICYAVVSMTAAKEYETQDRVNDALRASYHPRISASGGVTIIANDRETEVRLPTRQFKEIMQDRARLEREASEIAAQHGIKYSPDL